MTEGFDTATDYVLRDPKAFLGLLAFRGMRQADLARELGLSKQFISYVIRGERKASAPTAERIATCLLVHPSEVFEPSKTLTSA